MRKLLLLTALLPGVAIASVAAVSAALANELPKNVRPKPKAPQATGNPCAQYGAGFVQLPGTQTCVRVSGSVQTDFTTSGRARQARGRRQINCRKDNFRYGGRLVAAESVLSFPGVSPYPRPS